jgi:DNA-binding transcriptional LysR family regulator
MDNLRRIDLNLLVTLEALLIERNVTRAAQRLHLSQPSVSIQLRKLRHIFSDPLLTSVPGGMAPTTRALALLEPLREALSGIRGVLKTQPPFNPARADVTWHVAAADYAEMAIVLPLLSRLRTLAPNVRLAIREAAHSRMFKQIESGSIDLGLMALDGPMAGVRSHVLFKEHYVLVLRKGHPALRRKLTLDAFSKLDFVVVSPDGGGFRGVTDAQLESRGRKRRVVLSVPHFLFVPEAVATTNLAAMLPSRLIGGTSDRIRVLEPPLAIPSYEMAMIWHERAHHDPAHIWLRERVLESVR